MASNMQLAMDIIARDKASKTFGQVGDSADEAGKKFVNFGNASKLAFAAGAAALTKFAGSSIKAAADYGETVSKSQVLFGSASKAVEGYAASAAKIGQSKQQALDAAASFAMFGKSAGLSGQNLAKFSTGFVGLSADLASFNNTSPEEAIEAIGAALRGETEPIRKYGVMLDDATLRSEALTQGLIKTTKQALTPQQKVLAAQAAIWKQTTAAQGDAIRTGKSLPNQAKQAQAAFANLEITVGTKLVPAVLKAVNAGTQFAGWLKQNQSVIVPLVAVLGTAAATFFVVNKAMAAGLAVKTAYLALTGAQTAATAGATGAQAGLNAAMIANPIGLVIAGVVGLVAGFVVLYKKSETFRGAINGLWGGMQSMWGWVKGNWPKLLAILTGPFGIAAGLIIKHRDTIWNGLKALPGLIGGAFSKLADIITSPFRSAFNSIAGFWNKSVGSLSFSVPGWVPGMGGKGFSLPKIPQLADGGIVKATPGGVLAVLGEGRHDEQVTPLTPRMRRGGGGGGGPTINITVNGALDPNAVGRQVLQALNTYLTNTGQRRFAG